jgi:hypothetical protein
VIYEKAQHQKPHQRKILIAKRGQNEKQTINMLHPKIFEAQLLGE